MPADIIGTATSAAFDNGGGSISVPAGTTNGELLICIAIKDKDTLESVNSMPAAWTLKTPTGLGTNNHIKVWYRYASSEPASYTYTGHANSSSIVVMFRVSGSVTSGDPFDSAPAVGNGASGSNVAPSQSPTAADSLLIAGTSQYNAGGSSTYTSPGSMTELYDSKPPGGWINAVVAKETLTAAGATGTRTFTPASNSFSWTAFSFTIKTGVATSIATVTELGMVGSAQNKTSGTTLPVIASKDIPAGTLLILGLAHDNHASATATTHTLSNTGGVAWTASVAALQSGSTTTAGAGLVGRWWRLRTTSAIAAGATITTITFGNAIVAKAAVVLGLLNCSVTPVTGAATSGNGSTAGTPSSPTSGTAPATGDVVIGFAGFETIETAVNGDTDTLNGSWSTAVELGTTGGTAGTNVTALLQWKQLTAGGAQTFNPTGANDSVASTLSLLADRVTPVSASRSTTWNVDADAALTPVSASRSTSWETREAVAAARSTTWAVAAQVAASRASSWTVLAAVAAARATTWTVRTPVSSARSSSWSVAQLVTAARATTWGVGGSVTASRSTSWATRRSVLSNPRAASWAVLQGVQRSCNATWNVRQLVTASRSTLWETRATVLAARGTTWTVRTGVAASRSTTWNTNGTLAFVSASRSTTWRVDAIVPVSASRSTTWATRAAVAAARGTTWAVHTGVSANRSTTWAVRETVLASRGSTWAVAARVNTTRATSWDVRAQVFATRQTSWAVAGSNIVPGATARLGGRTVVSPGGRRIDVIGRGSRRITLGSMARQTSAQIDREDH